MSEPTSRRQIVADLRRLVAWLTDNPDAPLDDAGASVTYTITAENHDDAHAQVRRIAQLLGGQVQRSPDRRVLYASRHFGCVEYRATYFLKSSDHREMGNEPGA